MSGIALRPLHDRIIVKRKEVVQKGLIYVPESSLDKPLEGTVVAFGDGKMLADGSRVPPELTVGDTVLFGKNAFKEFKIYGEELLIIREEDILGVVS